MRNVGQSTLGTPRVLCWVSKPVFGAYSPYYGDVYRTSSRYPGAIEQDVAGGLTVWWGSTIPVPCQAERTPPYSAALRRLCSVYFVFVFFGFVLLLLLFGPSSLPSFGSLVSSLAHQLEIGMLLCFFSSVFCSILFFSFLVFRLVLSCRPSVGPSTEHITGLIVPASSNLVPSGLGLRHERMFVVVFVSFPLSFLSFRFFPFRFFPFFHYTSLLFRVYLSTMDTYVPGSISLQVIRNGMPQLASTVSLRTGTAVHVLFCFLPLRRFL